MTENVLGLPVEKAIAILEKAGVSDVEITEASAPRGNTPRGSLRVVRVNGGGRSLLCARFPDTVEETQIETV